jgi:hypothetical protein
LRHSLFQERSEGVAARSLDNLRAFFIQELVAAIRTEELDVLMPELLPMTIKLAPALRTGHPENFGHDSLL